MIPFSVFPSEAILGLFDPISWTAAVVKQLHFAALLVQLPAASFEIAAAAGDFAISKQCIDRRFLNALNDRNHTVQNNDHIVYKPY